MTDQYGTMRFKRTCVDGKQVSCLFEINFWGDGVDEERVEINVNKRFLEWKISL